MNDLTCSSTASQSTGLIARARPSATSLLTTALLASLGSACAPGGAAEAIRVEAPTAEAALGESKEQACTSVPQVARPLVIDLTATQRTDLELAMKSGRAVVHYGCDGLRVLTSCNLAGDYRFAGVSLKEEIIQLKSQDEVRASLPISGATLAGGVARGTSLDLAIAMIGRGTALANQAAPSELSGACEGATHFVRAVYVGAFAMKRGSGASVTAAASIFGASSDAASESTKDTNMRDGSLEDCKKADPDASSPPAQCRSSIRVELLPLSDKAAGGEASVASLSNPCPEGYAFTGGKCTPAATASSFLCAPGDENGCRKQCDAGNLGSCFNLAHTLSGQEEQCKGKGDSCIVVANAADGTPDHARITEAANLYERVCEGGMTAACFYVGSYVGEGLMGYTKSAEKADALFEKGCDGGHAWSCIALAKRVEERDRKAPRVLALYERTCDLGYKPGCFTTIAKYLKGEGTAKNPAAARAILERTCTAGEGKRCAELGLYALQGLFGDAAKDDKAAAAGYLARGCDLKNDDACRMAVSAYTGQWGVPKDKAKAQSYFDKGCGGAAASSESCKRLAAEIAKL